MKSKSFVKRIALQNYKSIKNCDVELGPLMLLVGPNGSGKSNFLDALRFVAESLRNTMCARSSRHAAHARASVDGPRALAALSLFATHVAPIAEGATLVE